MTDVAHFYRHQPDIFIRDHSVSVTFSSNIPLRTHSGTPIIVRNIRRGRRRRARGLFHLKEYTVAGSNCFCIMGNSGSSSSSLPPLEVVPNCDTSRFMGQWFVIGVKPTYFETTCSNAIEKYTRQKEGTNFDVQVEFTYNDNEPITSKFKTIFQKCWIQGADKANSATWIVSPFWPLKLDFPIIELDDKNYNYCVIGQNSRSYCWIMARQPQMADDQYNEITKKLVDKHQYNLEGFRKVPQFWTKEERTKRGISAEQIPDSWLGKELN